jgi:hypothetical protein
MLAEHESLGLTEISQVQVMTSYFWRRWANGGKLQLSAVTRDSVLFNRIFSTGGRLNRSEIF